jgi:hypothetical protein
MNTQKDFASVSISPSELEAILSHARAERADVMRAALSQLPGLLKRLVAHLRPSRQHLPQTGAWA